MLPSVIYFKQLAIFRRAWGRSHREELNNGETMRVRNVMADVKFAKVIYYNSLKQGRNRSMMLFLIEVAITNNPDLDLITMKQFFGEGYRTWKSHARCRSIRFIYSF
jgi:hypothetical protein